MDRTAENLLVMSKRIGELKQALASEQAARAAAERERDEYREGFHATDEMYKAAVAIFKEQRRVLGVPEGDGVSIIDHCADLVRRLGVAEAVAKNAQAVLDSYDGQLHTCDDPEDGCAEIWADEVERLRQSLKALAALGPAPAPTTPTH